jgi:hypothetical protein
MVPIISPAKLCLTNGQVKAWARSVVEQNELDSAIVDLDDYESCAYALDDQGFITLADEWFSSRNTLGSYTRNAHTCMGGESQ